MPAFWPTLFNIIGGFLDGYQGAVTVAGETVRGTPSLLAGIAAGESRRECRFTIDRTSSRCLERGGEPAGVVGQHRIVFFDAGRRL
jgi:hypothetical protein